MAAHGATATDVDFSAIEPDEAAIIQELARRTLAGESLASLCRELNAGGIPTAAGGRWSPATLRRILIGPHLAGLRVYGEQLYPAAWPAILSEDTHHALRALLTDPQRKTNPMRPTRHLWSGFLVCGHCGTRMYAYYRQAKTRAGQDAALPSQTRRLRPTRSRRRTHRDLPGSRRV